MSVAKGALCQWPGCRVEHVKSSRYCADHFGGVHHYTFDRAEAADVTQARAILDQALPPAQLRRPPQVVTVLNLRTWQEKSIVI